MITLNIPYHNDIFEVKHSLGPIVIIQRITYITGGHRQDVQFEDVPEDVQERILDKVREAVDEVD